MRFRTPVLVFIAAAIGGCQSTEEPPVVEWSPAPLARVRGAASTSGSDHGTGLRLSGGRGGKTQYITGTGRLIGTGRGRTTEIAPESGEEGVTLNLVNVPIPQAAKVVLGDILSVNFVVDPKVDGKVTVHTAAPVRKSAAIELFQSALRASNAAVVESAGLYKIVPLDQAATAGAVIRSGPSEIPAEKIGEGVEVIQLRHVSASEMRRVLDPITPHGAIVRADDARNALSLSGTAEELATIKDAIAMFDIDTMRGMSFALVPVKSSDADALAEDLRNVFGSEKEGPMSGMVRFIGNKRLSAILVISPQRAYLSRAEAWIRRLDARAEGNEKQFYSYKVQNRPAKELVAVLAAMFGEAGAKRAETVAPRFQPSTTGPGAPGQTGIGQTSPLGALSTSGGGVVSGGEGGGGISSGGLGGQSGGGIGGGLGGGGIGGGLGGPGGGGISAPTGGGPSDTTGGPGGAAIQAVAIGDQFKLAVDEAKNALVVMATPEDYNRLLRVVEKLDVLPNQVYLEATIAEVTLTDDLRFGVRWFLKRKTSSFAFSDAVAPVDPAVPSAVGAALGGVFPGFSYLLRQVNQQVTLHALSTLTKVNVLSTPSLTVLDNRQAVLQVGDQVPISTTTGGVAFQANSTTYIPTGVILAIRPHISESGRVMLELEQEVSDSKNDQTLTLGPTISQRKVKTQVVVNDGEALMLGGLIKDTRSRTATQVPVLGDMPVLGLLFKDKGDSIDKTELLIMITPHVIRSTSEAREITDEFKRKLLSVARGAKSRPHSVEESARRVLTDE